MNFCRPTCALLVLNYNGRSLLEQCLPSVVKAAQRCRLCEVQTVVVDNQSQDGSIEWVKEHLSQVVVLRSPENLYLYALNWAAEVVNSDYLVLLNNDVIMEPDSLDPLLEPLLRDKLIFSVTPLLMKPDRQSIDAAKRWGEFRRGFLHHDTDPEVKTLAPTLFPTGGAFSISRNRFLACGGFNRLYYPAYWEDVDLGYRAWKSGLINVYQPASLMYHMKAASWGKESSAYVQQINIRNSWLFTWHNVDDPTILAANLAWTVRYYLSAVKHKNHIQRRALNQAFRRWKDSWQSRHLRSKQTRLSDRMICQIASANEIPPL